MMLILGPYRKVFTNMYFREKQSWFSLKIPYFLKNSFLFKIAFLFTAYPYPINTGVTADEVEPYISDFLLCSFPHLVFPQLVICSIGSVLRELNHGAFPNNVSCWYRVLPLSPECLPQDLGFLTKLDSLAHKPLASGGRTSMFFAICFTPDLQVFLWILTSVWLLFFLDNLGCYHYYYYYFSF